MNLQWLTTLKSKTDQIKKKIEAELDQRGLKRAPQDLVSLVEEISPELGQKLLAGVLRWGRPFLRNLGLRVSQLTDDHIEIVIPVTEANVEEDETIHTAVVCAAVIEAAKILWERHSPLEGFKLKVSSMELKNFMRTCGELRVRYQILESERELVMTQLRTQGASGIHCVLSVYNDREQRCFEVHLNLDFEHTAQLSTPSTIKE